MPSSKRRKTAHRAAATGDKELTQAEIWDDSALIQAWNDAYAEYEYYHGIHARGEDVEKILQEAEEAEEAESAARKLAIANQSARQHNTDQLHHSEDLDEAEEGEVNEQDGEEEPLPNESSFLPGSTAAQGSCGVEHSGDLDPRTSHVSRNGFGETKTPPFVDQVRETGEHVSASNPSAAVVAVDQTLENIKMAYYWAGYYSGLYDGQKLAHAPTQKPDEEVKEIV